MALLLACTAAPLLLHAQRTTPATRPATPPATQAAVFARVIGTVWDSIAMRPLGGATVRIVRADDPSIGRSATTTAFGQIGRAHV